MGHATAYNFAAVDVAPSSREQATRHRWGLLLVPVRVAVSLWGTLW
jgi:hypothetical protein